MDKPKILIIDDDPDVVELLRITLEANKYDVFSAGNGTEGLALIKKIRPDLIILDVMMETMTDGLQISYKLRSQDPQSEYREFSKIPILMITGVSQKMHMKLSPEKDSDYLPVDDFLEKPIRTDPFLEKIKKLISR